MIKCQPNMRTRRFYWNNESWCFVENNWM